MWAAASDGDDDGQAPLIPEGPAAVPTEEGDLANSERSSDLDSATAGERESEPAPPPPKKTVRIFPAEPPNAGLRVDTRLNGSPSEALELDSFSAVPSESEKFLPNAATEEPEQFPHDMEDEQILSAVVNEADDPTLPTLTFRFWILGSLLTVLAAGVGQFYYFRSATLSLSLFFVQLVSFVLGNAMARWLPHSVRLFGREFVLNEGPFNVKEHTLICICSSTSLGVAYAIDILAVQRLFYNTDIGPMGSIMLLMTTQCIGYGLAGMLRKWLVEKREMVWPGTLPIIALFNTLHGKDETGPSHAKSTTDAERRMNFFVTVFFASVLYGFLPSYIAPTLTSIAVLCLLGGGPAGTISKTLAQLGSGYRGAGILNFTLDWNYAGITGPLYTPLWSQVNYIVSALFFAWIVTPLLYHSDVWSAKTFPMFGTASYSQDGSRWNVTQVLHANLTLNEAAYEQNPIRLSTFWAFMYGISFANLTAVLVHVGLYHGADVWKRFRTARDHIAPDVHTLMMRVYDDVPDYVYLGIFFATLGVSMFVVEYYDLQLPWWGVILAVIVAVIFVLPVGILQAVSNQQVGLNVLTEFIAGLLLPGQPIANIVFKTYGYMALSQALSLVADLKIAHYMKIPPRSMLVAQLWGTFLGGIVNYAVMDAIIRSIDLLSNPDPNWNPRASKIFYTASLIWGAVGPARLFGGSSPYRPLLWFFLLGAVLPVPFYMLHRRYPKVGWDLVCIPIIALGAGANGGSGANWMLTSLLVSWFFMSFGASPRSRVASAPPLILVRRSAPPVPVLVRQLQLCPLRRPRLGRHVRGHRRLCGLYPARRALRQVGAQPRGGHRILLDGEPDRRQGIAGMGWIECGLRSWISGDA
ncbi:OPT oligopeptide transporter protein-domain-containing protein [Hyaloraphidium curvatum]|nr:OPT oligopeptide transporter protein-domain-containing protein [Hyaloraphidium curvatum]